MSGPSREKDAADYDLERFTELFDQAITSDDPRVKNALRQLMMMVILTDTDDHEGKRRASHGPLRQMQSDMRDCFRWIQRLESEVEQLKKSISYNKLNEQVSKRGGFWPQDYQGNAIPPNDYWNSVIAQKNPTPLGPLFDKEKK